MKVCKRCLFEKQDTDFSPRKNRPVGQLRSYCKKCQAAYSRAHQRANPEKVRQGAFVRELKRMYGLIPADVERMFADQAGCCGCCRREISLIRGVENYRRIDHDHATGKVRKLLCINCNAGLGQFKDRVDGLRQAIAYLEEHNAAK